ncbi:lipoate--protein ligase family protein [Haloarculaceae archaeon H-GB11]|nr:lipoate--protein ligase family protein [Haloarculaceae archaeon H-GB11]
MDAAATGRVRPRDVRSDGYDRARETAESRGYPPVERESGGRAVAFTGTTVAFARTERVGDERRNVQSRYETVSASLVEALASLGVDARAGEPDDSFCPGTHSLQADGKLVGVAQRVHRDVAMVAGVVVPREHEAIAAVLDPVYDALGLPFDPHSVGSVARAGGDGRPDRVVAAIEDVLAAEDATALRVRDT